MRSVGIRIRSTEVRSPKFWLVSKWLVSDTLCSRGVTWVRSGIRTCRLSNWRNSFWINGKTSNLSSTSLCQLKSKGWNKSLKHRPWSTKRHSKDSMKLWKRKTSHLSRLGPNWRNASRHWANATTSWLWSSNYQANFKWLFWRLLQGQRVSRGQLPR